MKYALERVQVRIAEDPDVKNRKKYEGFCRVNDHITMNTKTPTFMLAPCGINCAVCYAHLRKKKTCPGCRGQAESQPTYCRRCQIRDCVISLGIDFCSECASFPCTRIKQIDKRYRLRYHVNLIENAFRIKNVGAEQFLREDEQDWTCPGCGGVVCMHSRICSCCGKEMEEPV